MKASISFFSAFLILCVSGTLWSSLHALDSNPLSSGWYENAAGFKKAVQEADRLKKPLVIYVYAPWCPYCRRFEANVLKKPFTRKSLEDYIKVRIYPEVGEEEGNISERLGVIGYPSIFLRPAGQRKVVAIETGMMKNSEPVLKTPEEFVQSLKEGRP